MAEASTAACAGEPGWVDVLVDSPGAQGLYTYARPAVLPAEPGDIVSVPFGAQTVGGIVVRLRQAPPPELAPEQIRPLAEVVTAAFFPAGYWQLLERTAAYYHVALIQAIRVALPPGLLGRSRRRVRLRPQALPPEAEANCPPPARAVLAQLRSQSSGDYSAAYLQRRVAGAQRGIRELRDRGWVETYLDPPRASRPQRQKAVTFVAEASDLTPRQQEVLAALRRRGGELWHSQLLQVCQTATHTIAALERRGCVTVQQREVLRTPQQPAVTADAPQTLTEAQACAVAAIERQAGGAQLLLHGITGSGKTEVYLQAIAPQLARGHSALVLVPEIGLTPQLTDRFRARFGERVRVYHSALSAGERYDAWRQMLAGEPQVAIGTRSAVFAPLPRLGLIVLDEEHDASFKQDRAAPTYHARTVAQWRAELADCPLVLGSATPSLESWLAASEGAVPTDTGTLPAGYLSLPARIGARALPDIAVADMRREFQRGNRSIFSHPLHQALAQLRCSGQQGILFVPRRGHSTFVCCRSCGHVIECPHCDISLAYHGRAGGAHQRLRCHYCNHQQPYPRTCPGCGSPYLKHFGSGTQRVMDALAEQFPQLRALRYDRDTTRAKGAQRALLSQFAHGEADLLVGTQMLAKGLDVPNVTLVGVVSADGLLHRSDYRAGERAFQTLTQVAGRAGRGRDPGRAIIQTYSPEHAVVQAVRDRDYAHFARQTLAQRAAYSYPPCGRAILLQLAGPDASQLQQAAQAVARQCRELAAVAGYEVLGPAPAGVMRVAGRYRWQILIKQPREGSGELPDFYALHALCPRSVGLTIDVDPLDMD